MRSKLACLLTSLALTLAFATSAGAHEGPPYPILVDKPLGPSVASVWADPDVGTGTFFIILEPTQGDTLPEEIRIDIVVRPADGHLPEAAHAAEREGVRGRVQYKAEVAFDAEGPWHVRVALQSPRGNGEIAADVEVTPPGLGRWDLLLYLFPFLLIGALWLRAVTRRGRAKAPRP
jgi:hypothetical protein